MAKKVLIVEDDSNIAELLNLYLEKEGFEPLVAKDGGKGVEQFRAFQPDLVLLDIMLPVMDGWSVLKKIRESSKVPVIMLTAKGETSDKVSGLEMGADDYIPKPFSLTLVTTKIRNLFRTRYRAIQYYSNSLEIEPEKLTLSPLDEEVLKKAMEIMEQHLDDVEFSTEEFAREMCMSRSSLHLKMKALTGESTNDFIRKIRFNRACKLLKEGRYTVAEISVMVGFSTPSYFATSFKKYFGCLPSEYIKNK